MDTEDPFIKVLRNILVLEPGLSLVYVSRMFFWESATWRFPCSFQWEYESLAVEQSRCTGWSAKQSLGAGLSAFPNIDLLILKPTDGKCMGNSQNSLSILISMCEFTKIGDTATPLATLFCDLLSLWGVKGQCM